MAKHPTRRRSSRWYGCAESSRAKALSSRALRPKTTRSQDQAGYRTESLHKPIYKPKRYRKHVWYNSEGLCSSGTPAEPKSSEGEPVFEYELLRVLAFCSVYSFAKFATVYPGLLQAPTPPPEECSTQGWECQLSEWTARMRNAGRELVCVSAEQWPCGLGDIARLALWIFTQSSM